MSSNTKTCLILSLKNATDHRLVAQDFRSAIDPDPECCVGVVHHPPLGCAGITDDHFWNVEIQKEYSDPKAWDVILKSNQQAHTFIKDGDIFAGNPGCPFHVWRVTQDPYDETVYFITTMRCDYAWAITDDDEYTQVTLQRTDPTSPGQRLKFMPSFAKSA